MRFGDCYNESVKPLKEQPLIPANEFIYSLIHLSSLI